MLFIIPFFHGDKPQAVRLSEHIARIGGAATHDCLLAVHKDTDSAGVVEPLRSVFRRVAEFSIPDDMIVEREQHAYAANVMWKRTANHVADMNEPQPWCWVEPDAVPLPGFFDAIAEAHAKSGKAFLHCLVETPRGRSNSGCGVYPAKVRDYTDRLWELSDTSWDILLYPDFAPHTAYTNLIQDIGFLPGTQTLPTFPDAASLSILSPGALLFHRSKDGSLIERLREKLSGNAPPPTTISGRDGVSENASLTLAVAAPPSADFPCVANCDFRYTLADLVRLRGCLKANSGKISRALTVFGEVSIPWLEFAEQINDDPLFPEKHFRQQPSERLNVIRKKAASAPAKKKQKRTITPEHKAKLRAALALAREAKARKAA